MNRAPKTPPRHRNSAGRGQLNHTPHNNNIDVRNKCKGFKSSGDGFYYRVVRNLLGGNRYSAWRPDSTNRKKYISAGNGSGLFFPR